MTAPDRAGTVGGPRLLGEAAVATTASRPDGSAALAARLAAIEEDIRDDRYRQPAAVLEAIARLWTEGATVSETAAGAGITPHIVRDRLRRAGALGHAWRGQIRHVRDVFERRGAELAAAYEAGASITALAAEAGVSRPTLGKFLVARGVQLRHDRGWYRRRGRASG